MNIRPMDLQVMIPRTMDAARVASTTDQQSVTYQQQLAVQLKQTTAEQQQQVLPAKSSQHDGKVSTEDLSKEKRDQSQQHKEKDDQRDAASTESPACDSASRSALRDPLRGNIIDIKT